MQDPKYVEVVYNQISTYKTIYPDKYDAIFMTSEPFESPLASRGYLGTLRILSPYYDDALSISSVNATGSSTTMFSSSLATASTATAEVSMGKV